ARSRENSSLKTSRRRYRSARSASSRVGRATAANRSVSSNTTRMTSEYSLSTSRGSSSCASLRRRAPAGLCSMRCTTSRRVSMFSSSPDSPSLCFNRPFSSSVTARQPGKRDPRPSTLAAAAAATPRSACRAWTSRPMSTSSWVRTTTFSASCSSPRHSPASSAASRTHPLSGAATTSAARLRRELTVVTANGRSGGRLYARELYARKAVRQGAREVGLPAARAQRLDPGGPIPAAQPGAGTSAARDEGLEDAPRVVAPRPVRHDAHLPEREGRHPAMHVPEGPVQHRPPIDVRREPRAVAQDPQRVGHPPADSAPHVGPHGVVDVLEAVEAIERGDRRPLEMIVQPGAHDDVVLGVLPQHDPRAPLMPLPPRSPGGPYRHLQIGEARVRPGTGVDGPPPRGEGPGPLHLGAPPRDDDEA